MDARLRIIIQLPLRELWREDGFSTTQRGKSLRVEDVRELLTSGPVQFVVGDVGTAPRWVSARECFHFWKNEVEPQLASGEAARLDAFPGGYFYFATLWESPQAEKPIIVLEKHH